MLKVNIHTDENGNDTMLNIDAEGDSVIMEALSAAAYVVHMSEGKLTLERFCELLNEIGPDIIELLNTQEESSSEELS